MTRRRVNIGSLNSTAQADSDGGQVAVYLEGGREERLGNVFRVRPLTSLQYIYLRQKGFEETGAGVANLTVNGLDVHSLRAMLGMNAAIDTTTRNGWGFTTELRTAWQFEFLEETSFITNTLAGTTVPSFVIRGTDQSRHWAFVGGGFRVSPRDYLELSASYDAQLSTRQSYHLGTGTMTLLW